MFFGPWGLNDRFVGWCCCRGHCMFSFTLLLSFFSFFFLLCLLLLLFCLLHCLLCFLLSFSLSLYPLRQSLTTTTARAGYCLFCCLLSRNRYFGFSTVLWCVIVYITARQCCECFFALLLCFFLSAAAVRRRSV